MKNNDLIYGPLPKSEKTVSDLKMVQAALEAVLGVIRARERRIAELEAQVAGHPEAIAAAKREALEAAAKFVSGFADHPMSKDYLADLLRRMAREVKP